MYARFSLAFFTAVCSALSCPSAAEPQQPRDTLVTISKETTVLTEPLDEEGCVDYLAAINQRLSDGVTTENNAVVPLRVAFGLFRLQNLDGYNDQFDTILGIEPAAYGIFVPLADTARASGVADANEARELLTTAHERPWTPKDHPVIAAWLADNGPALEMITAATRRPRFYAPYIAGDASPKLIGVWLPILQHLGDARRALVARALLYAGEGELDKALDDLEATHRLARLAAQDPTFVGGHIAIAIDSLACRGDVAVVSTGALTTEQLAEYLQRLNQLPPLPPTAERVDGEERLMFVEVVVCLARRKWDHELLEVVGLDGGAWFRNLRHFPIGNIDWDAALREGHDWYDRVVAAMEHDTFAGQDAALSTIEADVQSLAAAANNPLRLAKPMFSDNAARKHLLGEQIGETLVSRLFAKELLPAAKSLSAAEQKHKMTLDLTRLAVALEIYRSESGEYPESLDAIARRTVDLRQVPQDRFSGKPLHYERRDGGYLLYSVGQNGQDDHATSHISGTKDGEHVAEGRVNEDECDDLVIRVRLPM